MFQRGLSFFIADFSAAYTSDLPQSNYRIIWQICCVRLVMVISVVPLRITQFPQSAIKECIERRRRWAHGLVEERGQYLYVTSGIGTSGLPLRWGVPPEIVVLDTAGKQRT